MMSLVKIQAVALAVMAFVAVSADAARDGYEIDLRELRAVVPPGVVARPGSYAKEPGRRGSAVVKNTAKQPSVKPLAVGRKITVVASSPCKMAREMAEKMRLLKSFSTGSDGEEVVSAEYAGQGVTVACGISKAEKYTLERLLSTGNSQLLTFESDEFDERFVMRFANYLGLTVLKLEDDAAASKSTYIFPPSGIWAEELQLMVIPAKTVPSTAADKKAP